MLSYGKALPIKSYFYWIDFISVIYASLPDDGIDVLYPE